jgi:hypothetical protein
MPALQPSPVVQPAPSSDQQDVIEIVGSRPDQALKIDRRAYQVQQTPHSQQKDAVQLLRGLPAVTVSPDDDISLLGSGNVRIFVDGRPYGADPKVYLRNLHGGDVERIDVITNPSAQYSAEGTAGIINFVLRHKQGEGVSGTALAEISAPGHSYVDATVKAKHGKWTYELHAGGRAGKSSSSTYHKLRDVESAPGGTPTINSEDGGGSSRGAEGEGSAKATYELDSESTLSASLLGAAWRDISNSHADFAGLTPDFLSFTERQRDNKPGWFMVGELNFDHKGSKEGETLTALFRAYTRASRERSADDLSNGSSLSIQRPQTLFGIFAQADLQHPLGKGAILSIGGTWNYRQLAQHYRFENSGSDGSLGPNSIDQYEATGNTLAAYVTFQQPIGSWTVMPGIRVERNSRRISTPALPDVRIDRTNGFPTLHIEHQLTKTLDLTLSYSKRIDRAPEDWLRPFRQVEDVLSIVQGNPNLRDQSTDSFEINLHYRRNKIDAGMIIYDRETSRLWNQSYSAVDGVNVFTFLNAGHAADRGAELDLSSPIVDRLKVNASINLFDQRIPLDLTGTNYDARLRFTANTTLEWDGPQHEKIPGDVAQLQWIYNSPARQFQISQFAWNWLSASYSHSFNRTVSLTATMSYTTANSHWLLAPLVQEFYRKREPAEFKIKFLKTFGKP